MPDCRKVLAVTVAVLGLALSAAAQAQGYPARPVKLVVPHPPGGPTDIVARVIGQKLSEQTGQQFIVDNRAAAGGNIGAAGGAVHVSHGALVNLAPMRTNLLPTFPGSWRRLG